MSNTLKIVAGACVVASLLSLGACGRRSEANVSTSSTTVGQELADLEKAKEQGLITESEYKKQRKKILERD